MARSGQLRLYHSGCITSGDLYMPWRTNDTDSVRSTFLYREEWWIISQMCCREEKKYKPFRLSDNAS